MRRRADVWAVSWGSSDVAAGAVRPRGPIVIRTPHIGSGRRVPSGNPAPPSPGSEDHRVQQLMSRYRWRCGSAWVVKCQGSGMCAVVWWLVEEERDSVVIRCLRARPKAERVFAEYENFLKLSDPTVTLFSVLYLLNQTTDWQTVFGIWKPQWINHSY